MRAKFCWGLSALILLVASIWWSPQSEAAQSVDVFVSRSKMQGVEQNGRVYSPAAALLKALGYQWSASGATVQLTKGTSGGPDLRVKSPTLSFVIPSGKTISSDTLFLNNESWVQVKPLAEALGGRYFATGNIIQVVFTREAISQRDIDRAVKQNVTAPAPTPSPVKTDTPTTDKGTGDKGTGDKGTTPDDNKEEKDPIEVVKVDYSNPIIPGSKVPAEVRGTATIKNASDQRVSNVKFTVELKDLGGTPIAAMPTKFLSSMEPGETSSQEFLWYNYYNQSIEPKVKVEHDPLPKKKKKDEKGGEGDKGATPSPAPSGSPSK